MSVWLRLGRDRIRVELLGRWRRPPVVAPSRAALRSLVEEAAGLSKRSGVIAPEDVDARVRRLDAVVPEAPSWTDFSMRAAAAKHVRLVVPDATRRGPWMEWAYPSARWLEAVTPRAISRVVLVATGVHRPALAEGVRFPAGWSLAFNGEDGFAAHREAGRTPAGTPVRLHPKWMDGDLRVILGDVSFHYFAGFGGGRKLVFPGLGDPEGIVANHRLSLDAAGCPHRACAPGALAGNPVHEDLVEATRLCPPHLLLQIQDAEPGGPELLRAGDWITTHEEGCRDYLHGHRIAHSRRPDLLVCDAGGHPRDATFLQAHKSLQHAARFLSERGRLLLVAAIDEGSGSATLERLWGLDADELNRRARESYEIHTQTALALRAVLDRCEVGILCRLSPDRLKIPGIRVFQDLEDALRWAEGERAPRHWGWLSRAEEVLPKLIGAGRPAEEEAATARLRSKEERA